MDGIAQPTPIPPRAYVFVSQWQFLALHNFELIGEISSSAVFAWADPRLATLYVTGGLEYLYDTADNPNRLPTLSPFAIEHAFDPLERELETVRFDEFPLAPSRLSALYAFPDAASCQRAAELHGWPLDEVREVGVWGHPLVRIHRGNMNLVSLMRGFYESGHLPADQERRDIFRAYWRGSEELPLQPTDAWLATPLWELLVEGKFLRTDDPRATGQDVVDAVHRSRQRPSQ